MRASPRGLWSRRQVWPPRMRQRDAWWAGEVSLKGSHFATMRDGSPVSRYLYIDLCRRLTVAVWMEENSLNADVQLSDVFAEHVMLADANFPRCRIVRQKLRPHRPVNSVTTNSAPGLSLVIKWRRTEIIFINDKKIYLVLGMLSIVLCVKFMKWNSSCWTVYIWLYESTCLRLEVLLALARPLLLYVRLTGLYVTPLTDNIETKPTIIPA